MMSFIINTVLRGNVGFASFSFPFRVLRQRDNCNNCNEKKEESPEVFGLQLSAPPIALGGMRHSTPAREGGGGGRHPNCSWNIRRWRFVSDMAEYHSRFFLLLIQGFLYFR